MTTIVVIVLSLAVLCSILQPASSYVFVVPRVQKSQANSVDFGSRHQHYRNDNIMSLNVAANHEDAATATTATKASSSVPGDDFLDRVLQVAIEASKKAGDIIVGNAGGAEVTERKANSRDLLTLIDPLCEKVRAQPT